jgi:hypothetical protein
MDWMLELIAPALGIALGYFMRRAIPTRHDVIERLKIEYVDRPVLVEKEKLRVEYVDKPVIVEKPVLQVERVPQETVVRHERIEYVDRPVTTFKQRVMETPSAELVPVVYMDASERNVLGTGMVDARLRRPTLYRGDAKFQCAKQDGNGRWVYRAVKH